jgi:hypothetical protein
MLTLSLAPGITCRQIGHQFLLFRGISCYRAAVLNSILNNLRYFVGLKPTPPFFSRKDGKLDRPGVCVRIE